MTYRESRERRAERLRGWADKREERGTADVERSRDMASVIPFGQPILVGHHSEGRDRRYRDRIWNTMGRGVESLKMADSMRSRADNIEAAAEGAIYSDDPDAIERLEERIAELEAKREKVKAHNKEMRKPGACDHPAECDCRSHFPRDCDCKRHPLPGYVLQNLGGNITRQRQRLEQLKREQKARTAEVEAEVTALDGLTARQTATRLELEFPSKPDAEVRDNLKRYGFRWDRVAMVWHNRAAQLVEVSEGTYQVTTGGEAVTILHTR